MAKTQFVSKKAPKKRIRKFFSWFGRHKITAVFLSLVLALALYLTGSWVVLQIQIHFERERFTTTDVTLKDISRSLSENLGIPSFNSKQLQCNYTNIEIGLGSRSCDINYYLAYSDVTNLNQALQKTYVIEKLIKQNIHIMNYKNISLKNITQPDSKQIGSDSFSTQTKGITCGTDYWFSSQKFKPDNFPINFKIFHGLFVQLNCSGLAKAQYYPIANS